MKPVKTALSKTRAKASKNTPKKAPLKPKAARVTKTPKAVTAVIETDDQGLFIPFSGGVVKQKAYTDHFRLVTRPYTDRPSQFKAGDTVTIRRVSAQARGYIIDEKELWNTGNRAEIKPLPFGPRVLKTGINMLTNEAWSSWHSYEEDLACWLKPEHQKSGSKWPMTILQGPDFHNVIDFPALFSGLSGGLVHGLRHQKNYVEPKVVVQKDDVGLFLMVSGGAKNVKMPAVLKIKGGSVAYHRRLFVRPFTDRPTHLTEKSAVPFYRIGKTDFYVVGGELWHSYGINMITGVRHPPVAFTAFSKATRDAAAKSTKLFSAPVMTDPTGKLAPGIYVLWSKAEKAKFAEEWDNDPWHVRRDIGDLLEKKKMVNTQWDKPAIEDSRGHLIRWERIGIDGNENVADLKALREAVTKGLTLDTPVAIGSGGIHECDYCEEPVEWMCDGTKVFSKTACPFPNGLEFSFELNVPSGVMVVANDLRPEFEVDGDFNINHAYGCKKASLAYADIGCAHAQVGNSSPRVYRQPPAEGQTGDVFLIGCPDHDKNYDVIEGSIPGEQVAHISTDLWAFSIVDKDEFERRGLKLSLEGHRGGEGELVTTRPGVYRFTHYRYRKDFNHDGPGAIIYTRVEWVREPDPVRDFIAERKGQHFTAGQVIASSMKHYPTLYNGHYAVRRVADHIFCTIGGGGNWHENGFVVYDPDMKMSDPGIEIPDFSDPTYRATPITYDHMGDQEYEESWYPLCKYSALVKAGKSHIFMNPSFVALARNVARAVISTPEPTKPDSSMEMKHTLSRWRENIKLATEALAGIDKQYDADGQPFKKKG